MRLFLTALQFITFIPIPIKSRDEEIGRSSIFFPAVGAFIGILLSLVFFLFSKVFPKPVDVLLIIIASIIITGGFHVEGFIDVCDGFYVGGKKEDVLRIMKDPHSGAMGIIGAIILILSKFIIINSILPYNMFFSLVLMGILSRWSMVFLGFSSVYAREEGTAKLFVEGIKGTDFFLATAFTIVFSVLLTGISGIFLFVLVALATFLLKYFFNKKISGVTGDTLGAANEIIEVFSLLMLLLFFR